jgi:uncharacterized membrane protein YbjE (DUF340 family)
MSKLTFGKMSAPTPLLAKKIRNTALKIGGALVLLGGAITTLPVSLPATVVAVATNAMLYGGVITTLVSAVSQAFGVEEDKTNN